jgi:hypothetical protein
MVLLCKIKAGFRDILYQLEMETPSQVEEVRDLLVDPRTGKFKILIH